MLVIPGAHLSLTFRNGRGPAYSISDAWIISVKPHPLLYQSRESQFHRDFTVVVWIALMGSTTVFSDRGDSFPDLFCPFPQLPEISQFLTRSSDVHTANGSSPVLDLLHLMLQQSWADHRFTPPAPLWFEAQVCNLNRELREGWDPCTSWWGSSSLALSWSTDLAVPISDLQLLLYGRQTGDLYQVGAEATSYTDPETGTISGVTVCSLPHCVHASMFCVKENS